MNLPSGRCPRCNGAGRLFVADPTRVEKDDPYTCPKCVSESSFGTDAHVAAEAYWRVNSSQDVTYQEAILDGADPTEDFYGD